MLVEVGKFTFPADFVILKMEEDSKVPLILERPFLHTADVVIRVKQKQLNLGVGTEQMIFNINSAMKHSYSSDDTCFSINVINEILEEDFDALLDEGSKILYSIAGTLLEEEISDSNFDNEDPPFEEITINTDYKIKTSLEEPPKDLKLKPLPDNLEYVFLEESSFLPVIISSELSKENKNKLIYVLKKHKQAFAWKTMNIPSIYPSFCKHKIQLLNDKKLVVQNKQGGITVVTNENDELVPTRTVTGWLIPIDPNDQEKTTFTCPFGTYAYRRMPFGLCNAPATFQRCMLAIFHDMIEESVKVFMGDFSVFRNSFDTCLNNLDKMLQRCKDAHLLLNWEKCHFMVKEGIVLGHKVSSAGLEVDNAKIDVILKLPPPTNIKGIGSFLGHAGFYRRFIKDFLKIARPLTKLLKKDTPFEFDDECQTAFESLKEKLTCPVTTEEKVQKKNDVKARSMLLMTLPNEHLMTFNQYKDAQTFTNEVNTAYGVSIANTQVSPASTQVSTASTHLALLSMRTRRFFQKTGRKITINGSDTTGYDKSKVECFNYHKMGYFTRECRGPRNQDSRNKNKDSSRRTVMWKKLLPKPWWLLMELVLTGTIWQMMKSLQTGLYGFF
ncbi:reverse transcriptase domain-containing protein [Tanacetum coccineum]|uniref:Reverse transcriptase domain-containing protein n=1 Tax=Tanacetum coccineum TaxID=301880 RepID=A0ABQ4XDG3_9ASTR